MINKILVLALFFSSNIYSEYIEYNDVEHEKNVLQVSSCEVKECFDYTYSNLQNEQYSSNEVNTTYIVNIPTYSQAQELQLKYKSIFPDSIIRRRFSDDKIQYAFKSYPDDFYNNKNYKAAISTSKSEIFSSVEKNRDTLRTLNYKDVIYIEGCNDYSWCKLQNESAFIAKYRLEFIKKSIKPLPKKEIVKVEIKKPKPKVVKKKKVISKYNQALNLFKNKQYYKSYFSFNKLFEKDLNNPNVNFYLGRSAFEIKKYQEAIVAYNRVLFEKPNNSRTKLEMARAYFLTNSYQSSKKLFLEVKNDKNIPKNVIKNVDRYLEIIDERTVKYKLDGILLVGINYDSNINASSKLNVWEDYTRDILNLPVDSNNTVNNNYNSAFSHQEMALFNYEYKLNDNHLFKTDFLAYNKSMFNRDYKDKDIKLVSLNPSIDKKYNQNFNINYGMFIDNLWIENENYMMSYGLFPKLKYIMQEDKQINASLKYQIKSHNQKINESKDSNYLEFAISLLKPYTKDLSFKPSFVYATNTSKDSNVKDINNNVMNFGFNMSYIYTPTLFISSNISLKKTAYEDDDSIYLRKKENDEYKLILSSTYIYNKKTILQNTISYLKQKSNIPLNEYDKYTFNTNIIRTF